MVKRCVCITHGFERFLEGLARCVADWAAGLGFPGWLTRGGFLIFRLSWWRNLLLVLFLCHLLKTVINGLGHLQGSWKETRETKTRADMCFFTSICFFLNAAKAFSMVWTVSLYTTRVLIMKLIHETMAIPCLWLPPLTFSASSLPLWLA